MAGFKGLDALIGRTITHVVVKSGDDAPRSQVMLVFSDDTVFEFYCSDSRISGSWMLDRGGVDKARSYIPENAVIEEHPAPGAGHPALDLRRRRVNRRRNGRRDQGTKIAQPSFRTPLLAAILNAGGKGPRALILSELRRVLGHELTDFDKARIRTGGVRWERSAEWEVRKLRTEGLLEPVATSGVGIWALTEKGRRQAAGLHLALKRFRAEVAGKVRS